MRMMSFTRCADIPDGPNKMGSPPKANTFYCPARFESALAYAIEPGERVMITVDSDDVLYKFNDGCCCGGCVSDRSSTMLTVEVANDNPSRSIWVPKKTLLSTLLARPDVTHRLCVSAMSDICEEVDDDVYHEVVQCKRTPSPADIAESSSSSKPEKKVTWTAENKEMV